MRGCFITFEGGEGAGKSTQIERLRRRLEGLGHRLVLTREPGGSPRAERIREVLLSGRAKAFGEKVEAVLFYAARLDHLDSLIRPSLERGMHVLCDRFSDSTRAYQGHLGAVPNGILDALERVIVAETQPDLTVLLDVPAEVGLARARQRRDAGGERTDRFEAEELSFHGSLREAFLTIAASAPGRCVVVDGNRELDLVEEAVWNAVAKRLPTLARPAEGNAHVA